MTDLSEYSRMRLAEYFYDKEDDTEEQTIVLGSLKKSKKISLPKEESTAFHEPGPSFSKLTTSLVNDSLKFTLSNTQIC